ncbi:MAG: hypothetical protein KJZ84_18095 [Bryobacteraceae bacterium]|nr:hypothetical protein [Bryobacteraceae bacterium]
MQRYRGQSGPGTMLTAYLDQNKWIELAKANFRPEVDPAARLMAWYLFEAVEDGRGGGEIWRVNLD